MGVPERPRIDQTVTNGPRRDRAAYARVSGEEEAVTLLRHAALEPIKSVRDENSATTSRPRPTCWDLLSHVQPERLLAWRPAHELAPIDRGGQWPPYHIKSQTKCLRGLRIEPAVDVFHVESLFPNINAPIQIMCLHAFPNFRGHGPTRFNISPVKSGLHPEPSPYPG